MSHKTPQDIKHDPPHGTGAVTKKAVGRGMGQEEGEDSGVWRAQNMAEITQVLFPL
jgi:hypothetical protein